MNFQDAVTSTPNLEHAWRPGLQALRAEDKLHIKAEDTRSLCGSADVDSALKRLEPHANRWDFAIAYQHTDRKEETIYWVETHTGDQDQLDTVLRKFEWLKEWLDRKPQHLAKFERDFVWISSGRTYFTKGSAQIKKLAQKGLFYAGANFRIRNQRTR